MPVIHSKINNITGVVKYKKEFMEKGSIKKIIY
jgi:hypothetical protein